MCDDRDPQLIPVLEGHRRSCPLKENTHQSPQSVLQVRPFFKNCRPIAESAKATMTIHKGQEEALKTLTLRSPPSALGVRHARRPARFAAGAGQGTRRSDGSPPPWWWLKPPGCAPRRTRRRAPPPPGPGWFACQEEQRPREGEPPPPPPPEPRRATASTNRGRASIVCRECPEKKTHPSVPGSLAMVNQHQYTSSSIRETCSQVGTHVLPVR